MIALSNIYNQIFLSIIITDILHWEKVRYDYYLNNFSSEIESFHFFISKFTSTLLLVNLDM